MKTRVMMPVLLCFDIEHVASLTPDQVREVAAKTVTLNLGKVGDEQNDVEIMAITDEFGQNLYAKIYPSCHEYCDTMGNITLDEPEGDEDDEDEDVTVTVTVSIPVTLTYDPGQRPGIETIKAHALDVFLDHPALKDAKELNNFVDDLEVTP